MENLYLQLRALEIYPNNLLAYSEVREIVDLPFDHLARRAAGVRDIAVAHLAHVERLLFTP
ncbi:MAG: hypothetical protein OEW16_09035 [Gammaproteobacteria bacterium]|nr:hypothetical protein [Gammaproteobacteria bacterium]